MNLAIVALASFFQSVVAAPGQHAAAVVGQPAPADHVQAAQELIATFNLDASLQRNIGAIAEASASSVIADAERRHGIDVPPDVEARWRQAALQDTERAITTARPMLERELVRIYVESFSRDELRRLTQMMRDPLMQRMTVTSPQYMQRSLRAMSSDMGSDLESSRLYAELREWLNSQRIGEEPTEAAPQR